MEKRILKAAAKEIELRGASFRMDDLAKRLNISKRTLYEVFRSKQEIIERILKARAEDFYEQHRIMIEENTLPLPELLRNYFSIRSSLYKSIGDGDFEVMFSTMPDLMEEIYEVYNRDWDLLQGYLEKEKALGHIKVERMDVVMSMLKGYVTYILFRERKGISDFYELMPFALDVILHGIMNEEMGYEK